MTPKSMKAARMAIGWTQLALAENAGVHHKTVLNYEKRQELPVSNHVSKIEKVLVAAGVVFGSTTITIPL